MKSFRYNQMRKGMFEKGEENLSSIKVYGMNIDSTVKEFRSSVRSKNLQLSLSQSALHWVYGYTCIKGQPKCVLIVAIRKGSKDSSLWQRVCSQRS